MKLFSPDITITLPTHFANMNIGLSTYLYVSSTLQVDGLFSPKPHTYLHQPPIPQLPDMLYLDHHSALSFPRLP